MHILLVEPDRILADTFAAAIRKSGHSVAWSRTAQESISSADERSPDLLIMETQLARHNGIELLYEFKSYAEWRAVPVIVLTSLPPQELELFTVLRSELGVVKILGKKHTSLKLLISEIEKLAAGKV